MVWQVFLKSAPLKCQLRKENYICFVCNVLNIQNTFDALLDVIVSIATIHFEQPNDISNLLSSL